jgi:hypothetical protein
MLTIPASADIVCPTNEVALKIAQQNREGDEVRDSIGNSWRVNALSKSTTFDRAIYTSDNSFSSANMRICFYGLSQSNTKNPNTTGSDGSLVLEFIKTGS